MFIDISTAEFPGTDLINGGYAGLRPSPKLHPHLRLDECMVSVPKVNPGDTVYWHCDVVHAVEQEHIGSGESAGKLLFYFIFSWFFISTTGVEPFVFIGYHSDVYSCRSSDTSKSRIY